MKNTSSKVLISLVLVLTVPMSSFSQSLVDMKLIHGGAFIPLYGIDDSLKINVNSFYMDQYPVTNKEFQDFIKENPKWNKTTINSIFADTNYLVNWKNDSTFPVEANPEAPVTNVSWFAAKNYCECKGKRLPLLDEWEYAAMADKTKPDARTDENYNQYILNWYESPKSFNKEIGSTFKNYWGIYDLHGLVWEWTMDFNSVLISGESRKDVDKDSNLFCGSASVGATDLMNYAAFMRYAFRGSLKARYSVKTLGFRCVKDVESSTTKTN
jgi:formylglycine-generating enzyme required for sulfatase activity